MDGATISAIIAAIGTALMGLVAAAGKIGRDKQKTAPPEPSGHFATPDIGTAARLDRIESALQEQAIERAREAVHSAESRRLVAEVATAVHALAMALEHVRRDADRNHDELRGAIRRSDRRE